MPLYRQDPPLPEDESPLQRAIIPSPYTSGFCSGANFTAFKHSLIGGGGQEGEQDAVAHICNLNCRRLTQEDVESEASSGCTARPKTETAPAFDRKKSQFVSRLCNELKLPRQLFQKEVQTTKDALLRK